MTGQTCDILIVGGGVGGVAAALAACSHGMVVILTEEYAWLGGQLTSQGVPPDEYPWIEQLPPTKLYSNFRSRIRSYYESHYKLPDTVRGTPFNPGGGFVSGLCHEPRIAHAVLRDMLQPYVDSQHLTVLTGLKPVAADISGERVKSVLLRQTATCDEIEIEASFFLDCTELGDLLPLTQTEYVSGAESRNETGELHAADFADSEDVQGFTWCLAVGYDPTNDHTIQEPAQYEMWRSHVPDLHPPWPGRLLSWTAVSPITLEPRTFDLFKQKAAPYNSLWNYRKIVESEFAESGADEVSLVNWPQNDYFLKNIIDKNEEFINAALEESRQLSLSLLYWMQTEAQNPDGSTGYRGLYPASAVLGTDDGLAMAPYIRESRRIRALTTVTEQHVGAEMRSMNGFDTAENFDDSIGVGCYRIDLHPTPVGKNYLDISSFPFQIPLGALVPIQTSNLIAANKNIGVTHITNGCFRLHPVEWNIGESAGHLTSFCINHSLLPKDVHANQSYLSDYQLNLRMAGIRLAWPAEVAAQKR